MNERFHMHSQVKAKQQAARAKRMRYLFFRQLLIIGISVFAIFLSVMIGFISSAQGNQDEEPVTYKYYKTIVIEPGDTLWDIAEEYCTDDYASLEDYISALKKMNHLNGDTIYAGERIMIAYQDTRFIK